MAPGLSFIESSFGHLVENKQFASLWFVKCYFTPKMNRLWLTDAQIMPFVRMAKNNWLEQSTLELYSWNKQLVEYHQSYVTLKKDLKKLSISSSTIFLGSKSSSVEWKPHKQQFRKLQGSLKIKAGSSCEWLPFNWHALKRMFGLAKIVFGKKWKSGFWRSAFLHCAVFRAK